MRLFSKLIDLHEICKKEKLYFSGKHKLYGFKVEAAVRPNGIASAFSKHYPGSISDISIMYDRIQSHKYRLEKSDEEKDFEDNFPMSERFSNYWGVLMDKGYQGASEELRAIIPRKKPVRGVLSRADEYIQQETIFRSYSRGELFWTSRAALDSLFSQVRMVRTYLRYYVRLECCVHEFPYNIFTVFEMRTRIGIVATVTS